MSDVGDIDDMVKNCVYLLSDSKRLSKFKQQARKRAEDFTLEKILPQYEKLYQTVLERV
jgi:glycosyltransferase involved in cell wall biosynthesis